MNFIQILEELNKAAETKGFKNVRSIDYTFGNIFNSRTVTIEYYNKEYNITIYFLISKNELVLTDVNDLKFLLFDIIGNALARRLMLLSEGRPKSEL